jgi:hypothetical protein
MVREKCYGLVAGLKAGEVILGSAVGGSREDKNLRH